MSDIKVGSIVFHKRSAEHGGFIGPGVVQMIEHYDIVDTDCYHVFWQSSNEIFEHFRSSLMTLAERNQNDNS